jgi:hypothetical protein
LMHALLTYHITISFFPLNACYTQEYWPTFCFACTHPEMISFLCKYMRNPQWMISTWAIHGPKLYSKYSTISGWFFHILDLINLRF